MPPVDDESILPGKWSLIDVRVKNKNAPFGIMSVGIIFNGGPDEIDPDMRIAFAGYFVGTMEVQNLMGGNVDCPIFVTNSIKIPTRSKLK